MNETVNTGTQQVPFPYLEMGAGFLIGLSIGYVLKKSFKTLLVLLGIGLIVVFVLESQGVVTLNEGGLGNILNSGMDMFKAFAGFLKDRLDNFHLGSGFSALAGFFIGLKMG